MSKDYQKIAASIPQSLAKFAKESPGIMQGFMTMSAAADKPGVLSEKIKELIALANGVSKQCDGCIGFHTEKLIKLGVTKEEIIETLNVAAYMGGGPALIYAMDALSAYEQLSR